MHSPSGNGNYTCFRRGGFESSGTWGCQRAPPTGPGRLPGVPAPRQRRPHSEPGPGDGRCPKWRTGVRVWTVGEAGGQCGGAGDWDNKGQPQGWQGRKLRTDLLLVSPEINSGLKNFITKLVPARLATGNPSSTSSRETQGQKIRGCHW